MEGYIAAVCMMVSSRNQMRGNGLEKTHTKNLGPSGYYSLEECNDHESAQYIYYIGYIIEGYIVRKFLQNKQNEGHMYKYYYYYYHYYYYYWLVPIIFYHQEAGIGTSRSRT